MFLGNKVEKERFWSTMQEQLPFKIFETVTYQENLSTV